MATNVKNAIAKALINGVVTDLFLKTGRGERRHYRERQ